MAQKWQTQGEIVARGEDGVPWELYENGYLLFTPTKEQNTLSKNSSWRTSYAKKIIAIGFVDKVFAPTETFLLFSLPNVQYIEAEKIDTSKVENMYCNQI